jgi:ankyrin repeat protein
MIDHALGDEVIFMLIELLHLQVLIRSICEAAAEGEISKVEIILQENPKLLNMRDDAGDMPIHIACKAGHRDVVELLIAKGAKVNVKDHEGQTPLHLAVINRHKDVAELLISEHAKINVRNIYGHTPLGLAISDGRKEIVAFLKSLGGKE